MSEQDSRKASVIFRDVVAYFTEEEWTHLYEWQKEFYKGVMMEVHQALLSLGYTIVNRDILLRINREKEASFLDPPLPEREADEKEPAACRYPAVIPDILLRIKHDEELYCSDWHDSLEAQIKTSYSTAVASCKISEEERNSVGYHQTEKRECASPKGSPPVLSACSLTVTPKGESHFQESREAAATGGMTSTSVCSWIPRPHDETNCQKNIEQYTSGSPPVLSACSLSITPKGESHFQGSREEVVTACKPTNIPDVVLMIKAEELSICKKEMKSEESGIHSVQTAGFPPGKTSSPIPEQGSLLTQKTPSPGHGTINPNTKVEDSVYSIEATEIFETTTKFENEWPRNSDNEEGQYSCTEYDQSLNQNQRNKCVVSTDSESRAIYYSTYLVTKHYNVINLNKASISKDDL
ncbi:hypothetical protein NDU88_000466 [Pleurodeles waltl]|uniref:KRAB domain-containing protein n=1 Tax=Pleurodeles waltl TaxID=8319 RepID=A0AAV7P496_PLEWA|nr:hypothetical protein NDU88_000466 [Pleurodeles waltl]